MSRPSWPRHVKKDGNLSQKPCTRSAVAYLGSEAERSDMRFGAGIGAQDEEPDGKKARSGKFYSISFEFQRRKLDVFVRACNMGVEIPSLGRVGLRSSCSLDLFKGPSHPKGSVYRRKEQTVGIGPCGGSTLGSRKSKSKASPPSQLPDH